MNIGKIVAGIVLVLIVVVALVSLTDVYKEGTTEVNSNADRNSQLLECIQNNPSKDREFCVNQLESEGDGSGP